MISSADLIIGEAIPQKKTFVSAAETPIATAFLWAVNMRTV
jgi:hypothetical protein